MSVVLYVGGSKDGNKGVVPYGFSKSRAMTDAGPEVYVERMVPLKNLGRVRVMALESLHESILVERAATHYAHRAR
ncbi:MULTISPECIES: hypothetical protein [Xanthomonas]|uniref:Uncharacterized protein n=1 Tax=Xanthomonas cucurbitae TaxID=56453 RepID=A0A2S7DIL5_9XANT|nr:hypothetical protein [Xanthomonas cucurbitae]PPU73651.1 hypothetical protein XcuCFBP2542_16265 [Xanthomonas cucurbitae]QHG87395.1 hypothetical protein EBN15_11005 [Xanthomonas cucurbitae]WDM69489.1 hypothetical protein K6981_09890 [Xanthomonas cucurbitae]WDM73363.1 hypothetical protein K6978_09865 [Xanthomonas cucurbitae]WDM73981.1 hypothetical protein K6982_10950 [Xanthomonas cucurbitae]